MKSRIITMLAVGSILMVGGYAFAQQVVDHGQVIGEAQAMADIAAKKAVMVNNKLCPVSGDAVAGIAGSKMGDKPVLFEYNGKIYHLCCPMCIKDFKNNPEKYSKIAEDGVKAVK